MDAASELFFLVLFFVIIMVCSELGVFDNDYVGYGLGVLNGIAIWYMFCYRIKKHKERYEQEKRNIGSDRE